MQNPDFLKACIGELEKEYARIEIVSGDRYHPVWAIRIKQLLLPDPIVEHHADIIIPMARCAGYLPGASLAGLHLSCALHSVYEDEETVIPFCDPVQDTQWMVNTQRFYPYYEHDPETLIGTSYLCLNDPDDQPETPLALMRVAMDYLCRWPQHAFGLAIQHGAIARGEDPGDRELSVEWIEHLVEQVTPGLRAKLLAAAYPVVRLSAIDHALAKSKIELELEPETVVMANPPAEITRRGWGRWN